MKDSQTTHHPLCNYQGRPVEGCDMCARINEQSKTALPANDIAHKVAEQVWTALDRKSCPDVYMRIAYDAAEAATLLAIQRDRGVIP